MLSRFLGEKNVYKILLLAYSALAIGLAFNKIVLSLATLLIAAICLFDFNLEKYKKAIQGNKIIQVFLLFLFLHLLSFFWSENTAYFLKDLNSKLPFYAIPLVFVLKPLQAKKELYFIFGLFLLSLTIISAINFISYYGWRKTEYDNIRNLSLFLSHIRFGLMLIFGMVLTFFWLKSKELTWKIIPLVLMIWFLVYTYFSEVFSCYLALFGVLIFALLYQIRFSRHKKKYIVSFSVFILAIFSLVFYFFYSNENIKPKLSELPEVTANGNIYEHDLSTNHFINGNFVFSHICKPELLKEWYKVSDLKISDYNVNDYHYYDLLQYMTSKGLTKDSLGFQSLTKEDVAKIERGIHNYKDEKEGFFSRMKTLKDEFSDSNPNGKTILQRIQYLKAGFTIFKKSWLFGIGSGDLEQEFKAYYSTHDTKLYPENQLRTHNQIATYFISFGVFGGILFLLIFVFAFSHFYKNKLLLPLLFLVIILISFLSEDTLETQFGATFFGFFFGIFISSTHLLNQKNED
ncbi:MAG: O-antigen ligase family protein [Bacteroidota bacterium]